MIAKKVISFLKKFNIQINNSSVLACVSGGADSVALLLALNEIKSICNFNLSAIHINHNLRGDESLRDEKFVIDLCKRLNIPLVVKSIDVNKKAQKNGESTELCARNIRYKLFCENATGLIATAHTADDNAETVLYNLCRGTGTKGIAGIPPVRDNIIRPILYCTRAEIEEYLALNKQDYVTDSTNNFDVYTRNKIRHNCIPVFKGINPAFSECVLRASEIARDDIAFIYSEALKAYEKHCSGRFILKSICNEPPALRRRILEMFCCNSELFNEKIDYIHISEMDSVCLGNIIKTSMPNGYSFSKNGIGFSFIKNSENIEFSEKISFSEEYKRKLSQYSLDFQIISKKEFDKLINVNNLLFKFSIDCDKITSSTLLRSRINGDKYRPIGRNVTKTIKKLLCESDLSYEQKSKLVIICDSEGIIFTNLFGIDERVKPDNHSKRIIVLKPFGEVKI